MTHGVAAASFDVFESFASEEEVSMGRYEEIYRRSLEEPEGFWAEAAAAIDWIEPWERVLDDSRAPFYRWFAGGRLNTCYNALDRHVERRPRRPAGADLRLAGDGDDARRSRTASCATRSRGSPARSRLRASSAATG